MDIEKRRKRKMQFLAHSILYLRIEYNHVCILLLSSSPHCFPRLTGGLFLYSECQFSKGRGYTVYFPDLHLKPLQHKGYSLISWFPALFQAHGIHSFIDLFTNLFQQIFIPCLFWSGCHCIAGNTPGKEGAGNSMT